MESNTGRKLACILVCALMGTSFLGGLAYADASVQTFPFTPQVWLPIAMIITITVIGVAIVIYMISKVMAYHNASAWAKAQMYEAALSIVLLVAFSAVVSLFFINPQDSYAAVGLLPPSCNTSSNIFELAACDLGTFTQSATTMFYIVFGAGMLAGNIEGFKFVESAGGQANLNFSFGLKSLLPSDVDALIGLGFSALLFAILLNDVQLIIISSSMLFLSLFLTLGLIARTFGVTRTFGGAMIALGLGLGLIYPILTTITYGFISTQLSAPNLALGVACIVPLVSTLLSISSGGAACSSGNIIIDLGYIVAGLTFIPFLNFIVLDAFITDFSRAVGEQITFMSMLKGLI